MQQIQKASKILELLIGDQPIDNTKQYRLLHYCLIVEHKGVVLIFNNLTKEFLCLTKAEARQISQEPFRLNNELVIALAKKWFLVPIDNDDAKLNRQIILLSRQFFNSNAITNYTILPTTACNARCFYCFEAGTRPLVMDDKTASDVADFIINKSRGNKVSITWFGGEPLCNYKAINTITKKLQSSGIDYSSRMVSNGYLFDDIVIENAYKNWKLRHVQITFDGTEKVYNRTKNYIYKDVNAFERVVNNLGKLLERDINVTIRLNMDRYNVEDLFKLVKYLADLYGSQEKFKIYPHLLFESEGYEKIIRTDDERNLLGKDFILLCEHIAGLGCWTFGSNLSKKTRMYFCMADSPNSIVIMPDGHLGRCEHYVDSKFIGDIYSEFDKLVWKDYCQLSDKCDNCPSLPNCLTIKNCPDINSDCFWYEQEEKILRLKTQMKSSYDNWNNKGVVKIDDDM